MNDMFDRWYLVDHWGRRNILMSGAAVVCPPNSPTSTSTELV
jgi:hypothetical protein